MSAEGRQSPIAHYMNTPKWLSEIKNHAERGTTFRAWMSLFSRKTQQKQQSGPSGDVPTVQVGSDRDSGRRTRLGFLGCCEAGRLVRHESRRQAMARVAGHLSVEDLEAGFRSARDPTAARHFQVI